MNKPTECPITMSQIFQAKFQPMTDLDYEGFAGMHGDGLIAVIDDLVVVFDLGPSEEHNLQVQGPDGECWTWSISTDPLQIN